MKKLLIILFLALNSSFFNLSEAQSWLWAGAGYGAIKTGADGNTIATDKNGNVYMTGGYASSLTFGTYTLNSSFGNIYVVKYNSAGIVQWAEQPGFNNSTNGQSTFIATDTAGNIYITGMLAGSAVFGSYTLSSAISPQGYGVPFIVKYDPSGNVIWAKQAIANSPPDGYNIPRSITVDEAGNSYITGSFGDTLTFGSFRLTGKDYPNSYAGNTFLVKYDVNGNVLWASQCLTPNATSYAYATSVNSDKNGNSYITGYFNDTLVFGADTLSGVGSSGGGDMFVAKYDVSGSVAWVTQSHELNTVYSVHPNSVITDNAQNIYVTGYFSSGLFIGSVSLLNVTGLFLLKFDTNGNVMWGKQPTEGYELATSLARDSRDHLYWGGYGGGDTLKYGGLTLGISPTANSISFIMELDTSGKGLCGSMLYNGGSYFPVVASDPTGQYIYIGAFFSQDTMFCGPDTLISATGSMSPYVARWSSCTNDEEGINNLKTNNNEIIVYPNPSTGIFTIGIVGTQNFVSKIEVYNVLGEKVYTTLSRESQMSFDLTGQPNGVYFYRVLGEDGGIEGEGKLVIEK